MWYHWFCKFISFSLDKIIFSIKQVSRDCERCLTASVWDVILCDKLLESCLFFSCNGESITAAHVRDHSAAMICSVQKCNWLCCNIDCHVFRNRQHIFNDASVYNDRKLDFQAKLCEAFAADKSSTIMET